MTELVASTDDGVRIRIRTDGPARATPLLLCNSLGTDLRLWNDQVAEWANDHLVIRFDQRGHGASGAPSGPYTYDRLGRDAATVLDMVEVERADVCGISLGAAVGLWLAAHRPERVSRLVAADTAARIGDEASWRSRAALVRERGMEAVAGLVVERFFSPEFRGRRPDVIDATRCGLLHLDPEGYAATCEALATGDLRGDLGSVTVPTLIVVGTADEATPPSDAIDLCERLADARLHRIEGAGHLSNLERPAAFLRAVDDFLAATTRGADT